MAARQQHLQAQTQGMNQCYSWKTVGIPAPQGSKRHVGMGRMIESSKALKPWRELIIADCKKLNLPEALDTPVGISLIFCFPRPKNHFNKKGELLGKAPKHKTTRPDIDKLTRAVLDALVYGAVIKDDSMVYNISVHKRFCVGKEEPGVSITVMDSSDLPFRP